MVLQVLATKLKSLQNEEDLTMLRSVVFAVFLQLAYCVSQPDEIVQPPPGKRNRFRLLQYSSNENGLKDGDSFKISVFFNSVLSASEN